MDFGKLKKFIGQFIQITVIHSDLLNRRVLFTDTRAFALPARCRHFHLQMLFIHKTNTLLIFFVIICSDFLNMEGRFQELAYAIVKQVLWCTTNG